MLMKRFKFKQKQQTQYPCLCYFFCYFCENLLRYSCSFTLFFLVVILCFLCVKVTCTQLYLPSLPACVQLNLKCISFESCKAVTPPCSFNNKCKVIIKYVDCLITPNVHLTSVSIISLQTIHIVECTCNLYNSFDLYRTRDS